MARRATQYPLFRQRRCIGHWSSSRVVAVASGSFGQPSNFENQATDIYPEALNRFLPGRPHAFLSIGLLKPLFSGWAPQRHRTPYWDWGRGLPLGWILPEGHHGKGHFLVSLLWSSKLIRDSQMIRGPLPHSMSGLRASRSVVCSNVCPMRHSMASERCLPTNWIVSGNPSLFLPHGTDILGDPLKS